MRFLTCIRCPYRPPPANALRLRRVRAVPGRTPGSSAAAAGGRGAPGVGRGVGMTEWWLWMYVAAMAGGVVLFSWWRADPRGVPRSEYRVAIAIPLWSGSWYLLMALGG